MRQQLLTAGDTLLKGLSQSVLAFVPGVVSAPQELSLLYTPTVLVVHHSLSLFCSQLSIRAIRPDPLHLCPVPTPQVCALVCVPSLHRSDRDQLRLLAVCAALSADTGSLRAFETRSDRDQLRPVAVYFFHWLFSMRCDVSSSGYFFN